MQVTYKQRLHLGGAEPDAARPDRHHLHAHIFLHTAPSDCVTQHYHDYDGLSRNMHATCMQW